ncbi:MAG: hypothetical protein JWO58_2607 [Chitinophagaceae bacterium]|nr:hypothetical protein [Chitinophagaceae bacterium]
MKPPIKNIVKGFSILVLIFFALSYYSYLVYNAALEGKESSFVAHHLTNFANYPARIKEVLGSKELAGIPPSYIPLDPNFLEVNHLTYNLYALNSFWNMGTENWDLKLFNLKNDTVLRTWSLPKKELDFEKTYWAFTNTIPRNSIILPDKSIIISVDESPNLMRLDSNSRVIWINHDYIYHHSLNLGADSNIWACTADPYINGRMPVKGIRNITGDIYKYKEDYITQIDKNSGKVLFHKGITEILLENHYKNFVFGYSDPDKNTHDPIHLNDIQPALKDSKYWEKGDLFLSIRHRSLIILYRPSTNKIIRFIFGEFINQHDVDILSDSTISIFNNNFIHVEKDSIETYCNIIDSLHSSEIITYNFKDSTFTHSLDNLFAKEKIWTETQGLHKVLSDGSTFIESQNQGKIFITSNNEFILKKMLHAPIKDYAYYPNWIRIYEHIPY